MSRLPLPVLHGDPEIVASAERSRDRVIARLDALDRVAQRPGLHEGTRAYLRTRIATWRDNLARVTDPRMWDGAHRVGIADVWEAVDEVLRTAIADYDAVEAWLATPGIRYPLAALSEWHGYTPDEYLAWHERFRDRWEADAWRTLGWQPEQVASVQDAVARQGREQHPDDDVARWAYEGTRLEGWRTTGIPSRRASLYARLDFSLDEALEREAEARETGDDIETALRTMVALGGDDIGP